MDQLIKFREEHDLTQIQLGDFLGVSGNTIARWEGGKVKTSEKMLELALVGLRLRLNYKNQREKIETMKNIINLHMEKTEKIINDLQ